MAEQELEVITLFMTTISSSLEVKKKCQKVSTVMASVGNRFKLVEVDIAAAQGGLANMRDVLKDPRALPPQLYSEKYGALGGYDLFENAVEDEKLDAFLKKEYDAPQ